MITALYCRLSLEDGKDNESMSISNQKTMLKDYAKRNGFLALNFQGGGIIPNKNSLDAF